eukprot:CAMPEP_0118867224 /NCGR_PEP_ID=MMETSP1163-20130328/10890_1 /TAXON_ID=124430 /ORGANISM="Phaeomonas parva, Strain CCMP2877" /LENGTH=501 /DNA_ID=CAMNT_0006801619 /DNA_START=151 /DNA_END=1653 /DNA_ORIENTATION=+
MSKADADYRKDAAFIKLAKSVNRGGGYPKKQERLSAYLRSGELPKARPHPSSPQGSSPVFIMAMRYSPKASDRKTPTVSNDGLNDTHHLHISTHSLASNDSPTQGTRTPGTRTPGSTQRAAWGSEQEIGPSGGAVSALLAKFSRLQEKVAEQDKAYREIKKENDRLRRYWDEEPGVSDTVRELRAKLQQANVEKEELMSALQSSAERITELQGELDAAGDKPQGDHSINAELERTLESANSSMLEMLRVNQDPTFKKLCSRFDRFMRQKEAALQEAQSQNLQLAEELVREQRAMGQLEKRAARDRADAQRSLRRAAVLEGKMEELLGEVASKAQEAQGLRKRLKVVRNHKAQLEARCAALKSSSDMKVKRMEANAAGAAGEVERLILDISARMRTSDKGREELSGELEGALLRERVVEEAYEQLQADKDTAERRLQASEKARVSANQEVELLRREVAQLRAHNAGPPGGDAFQPREAGAFDRVLPENGARARVGVGHKATT